MMQAREGPAHLVVRIHVLVHHQRVIEYPYGVHVTVSPARPRWGAHARLDVPHPAHDAPLSIARDDLRVPTPSP